MRHHIIVLALGVVFGATAACSHNSPSDGTRQTLSAVAAGSGPRWTTRLRSVAPTHLDSGDSTRHTSYGSALWTPGNNQALSMIHLQFTYTGPEHELSWAILYGNCGAASMTVIPLSGFPEIDLSAGGTADINAQISTEFPISGQYRLEIYKDRVGGEQAVVACGELKYSSG